MKRKNTTKTQSNNDSQRQARALDAKELTDVAGGYRWVIRDVLITS